MTTYGVGYFVGSLAKGSINRKLALALARLAALTNYMRELYGFIVRVYTALPREAQLAGTAAR